MRQFSAEYLTRTRRGMWEGDREALAALRPGECERVLDVGCGTGELSRVLAAETGGTVVGLDRDPALLGHLPPGIGGVRGDALSLPFRDGAFDLVVCQALLVNLPEPVAAVEEFARVARERVAAIEPDNAAVTVDSTVDAEPPLARRARDLYLGGVDTDAALGARAGELFEAAGLRNVDTRRHDHELVVAPPYDPADVEDATRKASAAGLRERRPAMAGDEETLDDLRERWREMGREVVRQVQAGEYRRREVVPFYVTVGEV